MDLNEKALTLFMCQIYENSPSYLTFIFGFYLEGLDHLQFFELINISLYELLKFFH